MNRTDRDTYLLSSGKEFSAHLGILGIREADPILYDGYDGEVEGTDPVMIEHELQQPLTRDERLEIAAYMVDLWNQWADLGNG